MVKWKPYTGMEYGLRTVAFVADYDEYDGMEACGWNGTMRQS